MRHYRDNPFGGQLEVMASMRDQAIATAVADLRQRDRITVAMRSMLSAGVPIEDISEASGLPVHEIRARVERPLFIGEDVDSLAGVS
jgi:hypothetical protein